MTTIASTVFDKWTSFLDAVAPKNPVTQSRELRIISESAEIYLGDSIYSRMVRCEGGTPVAEHNYVQLVKAVGKQISDVSHRPNLPFEFSVIDSKTVNAWCLPGGKIAFYRGLIEEMNKETDEFGLGKQFSLEEKIAAVMGHEITHATARHSARTLEFGVFVSFILIVAQVALKIFIQNEERKSEETQKRFDNASNRRESLLVLARLADSTLNIGYDLIKGMIVSCSGRHRELEADKYGMVYLKRAGYDPKAAIWLQAFFAKQHPRSESWIINTLHDLFSTHPHAAERIGANRKTLELINSGQLN